MNFDSVPASEYITPMSGPAQEHVQREPIQGEHNGNVIGMLKKSKQAARDYVRSIPVPFRAECVAVVLKHIDMGE